MRHIEPEVRPGCNAGVALAQPPGVRDLRLSRQLPTVTGYHCKLMNINNLSITIRCPRVSRSSSCPESAIQRSILDCLRNVSRFDGFGSREVGHRARNLENA